MERTIRWIDRCIKAHQRPHDQHLFGIVQVSSPGARHGVVLTICLMKGGLDVAEGGLREQCCALMTEVSTTRWMAIVACKML